MQAHHLGVHVIAIKRGVMEGAELPRREPIGMASSLQLYLRPPPPQSRSVRSLRDGGNCTPPQSGALTQGAERSPNVLRMIYRAQSAASARATASAAS